MLLRNAGIINEASAPVSDTVGVCNLESPSVEPVNESVVVVMPTSNTVPVLAPVRQPMATKSQSPAPRVIEVTVFGVAVVSATAAPCAIVADECWPTLPSVALLASVLPTMPPVKVLAPVTERVPPVQSIALLSAKASAPPLPKRRVAAAVRCAPSEWRFALRVILYQRRDGDSQ